MVLPGKELKLSKLSSSPLVNDSRWNSLSTREKAFVFEVNIKPTSYCNIKRQIQLEIVKNNKIRTALLLDGIQKSLPTEDPLRVQLVFDFVVKVKLISLN